MLNMRRLTHPSRLLWIALLFGLGLQGCAPGTTRLAAVTGDFTAAAGGTATIQDIRMWHAPERSRIVFDMDRQAPFNVFDLASPDRVVIDLTDVRMRAALPKANAVGQFIQRIRQGSPQTNTKRLVFDLKQPVRYSVQMLKPSGRYQYRLVVDFQPVGGAATPKSRPKSKSELLILIDPGHGGEDPGAVGKRTYEKIVVLQIAKKLKDRIDRRPGLRAELTRAGDYYISLRQRTRIARRHQADLFISVHADAFTKTSVRGASVYALSQRGASSEKAKWLANKENASDLLGGATLADKDNQLAGVLLDLSMSNTVNESIDFGRKVLAELKKIGPVHFEQVEQAGFAVLKSPDIPSILVETAYITNPHEEKLLMSAAHQNRIAAAIVAGIEKYVSENRSRYATR